MCKGRHGSSSYPTDMDHLPVELGVASTPYSDIGTDHPTNSVPKNRGLRSYSLGKFNPFDCDTPCCFSTTAATEYMGVQMPRDVAVVHKARLGSTHAASLAIRWGPSAPAMSSRRSSSVYRLRTLMSRLYFLMIRLRPRRGSSSSRARKASCA